MQRNKARHSGHSVLPPMLEEFRRATQSPEAPSSYATMIEELRDFLDYLAGARLDEQTSLALAKTLRDNSEHLKAFQVEEPAHMFGHIPDVPGHGQVTRPALRVAFQDEMSTQGTVTFGKYFLGFNGAAHGGAIAALFDEILAISANMNVFSIARTAYLHVDYRAIAPVGKELQVSAVITAIEGRKRFVRGELRDENTLCAEAEGLFLDLRPGQR